MLHRFKISLRMLFLIIFLMAVCAALTSYYLTLVERQRSAVRMATSITNPRLYRPAVSFTYDESSNSGTRGWFAKRLGKDFTSTVLGAVVSEANEPHDLSWLPNLDHLRHLEFEYCAEVTTLEPVANLRELEVLFIHYNSSELLDQKSFELICNRCDLQKFVFQQDGITTLEPITNLENLTELIWSSGFESTPKLELKPIGNLKALTRLALYLHHKDYDFSFLSSLPNLEDVIIQVSYDIDSAEIAEMLPLGCKHDIKRFK